MNTTLTDADLKPVLDELGEGNAEFQRRYPGIRLARLPVHTLYGGAHLFSKETPAKLATLARRHLQTYAPDANTLATALSLPATTDATQLDRLYERMVQKLDTEAIEDLRLDFEDGYGARADDEEDGHAVQAAHQMAAGAKEGLLPPFTGIRIKSLTAESMRRGLRTLDLFLTAYAAAGEPLPEPFYVTLPKVTHPGQVSAAVDVLELLEARCGYPPGAIGLELMIETVQSIINPAGAVGIPALIDAGRGRVTSAILGTFDYTASSNIASHYQDHRHPSADFARQMMQVCLTGTAVNICDGITNIMPIPPHRGADLTQAELEDNLRTVHSAWRAHFGNILHSLKLGFYQGWDLNPAQLPIRYAACYWFFLEGLADAQARLMRFIDQAAQASMVGNTFDDAASAQGLLNFFINGINCGALLEEEALQTGITREELHGRSFQTIVINRLKAVT